MANYYVSSTGSNTSPYDTWAKAATSFGTAVSAATAAGDVIFVDQGFSENLSADTTYTFANNISIICSNDVVNMPPQTLGAMGSGFWIGHNSASYAITLAGGYNVYLYGLTFRIAGASAKHIVIGQTDNCHYVFDNCYLWLGSGFATRINLGSPTSSINHFINIRNTTLRFGATTQYITVYKYTVFENMTISYDGSAPSALFTNSIQSNFAYIILDGCDLSAITGTLLKGGSGEGGVCAILSNCKIGSGVTVLGSQTPANKGASMVWAYNCSAGDQHYQMMHYDSFGYTVVDTGIYANDGAQYDGTNYCSWKIITTANASYLTPYVSPWIDCYHNGASAITPSLEILRDGSSTAYQNDEVWGEFSYQGTSGYPISTIVSDKKDLLASAADQTTGNLNASGWTGENATSWFGKLNPTVPITPAEIGHLRARVCVGEPSVTVYVDPTIRGRS